MIDWSVPPQNTPCHSTRRRPGSAATIAIDIPRIVLRIMSSSIESRNSSGVVSTISMSRPYDRALLDCPDVDGRPLRRIRRRRADGDRPLTDAHVRAGARRGFALVDGVLPAELVTTVQDAAEAHFPAPGSEASEQITDFGSVSTSRAASSGFNDATLHPR